MANRVSDMKMSDLKALIESIVDARIKTHTHPYEQTTARPLSDMITEMQNLLIESKPGDPSVVEMIREDRDR